MGPELTLISAFQKFSLKSTARAQEAASGWSPPPALGLVGTDVFFYQGQPHKWETAEEINQSVLCVSFSC